MPSKKYRVVKGLSVAPLSNPGVHYEIDQCLEWKKLPRAVDDVPSPEEVAQIEELEHLASQFPQVNPSWPTLMLIGRDCLWAMSPTQYCAPKRGGPMAIQTPLGWTLVGPKPPTKLNRIAGECPCGKTFKGVESLRVHIMDCHPDIDNDELGGYGLSMSSGASVGGESKYIFRVSVEGFEESEVNTKPEECDAYPNDSGSQE